MTNTLTHSFMFSLVAGLPRGKNLIEGNPCTPNCPPILRWASASTYRQVMTWTIQVLCDGVTAVGELIPPMCAFLIVCVCVCVCACACACACVCVLVRVRAC